MFKFFLYFGNEYDIISKILTQSKAE